ncbi:MAG: response regulator [Burkholderiales bacterium]|nr:response regulator [Burkholderiales bacterium]
MNTPPRVLVVDDTPANVKLLEGVLGFKGFEVVTAASGPEALAKLAAAPPDIVLLDIMMPGMSGYEVCKAIRAAPATALLPVVLVTSLDPQGERLKGIEAGADDFLTKPINQAELLARVRSLLRIKELTDRSEAQARALAELNATLEARVAEQMAQLERLGRLKNFFSAAVAESILAAGGASLLETHRRMVTVVFLDLRGFTAFTDTNEPEEVMEVLGAYHRVAGAAVTRWGGTVERFAGDGIMIFFNDPVPMPDPTGHALEMALEMQRDFAPLAADWARRGIELGLGIGVAEGYATLGAIGFEGRWDYAAIGSVTNLAARLCGEAAAGQIVTERRTVARAEARFEFAPAGDLQLKGIARPVPGFLVVGRKPGAA